MARDGRKTVARVHVQDNVDPIARRRFVSTPGFEFNGSSSPGAPTRDGTNGVNGFHYRCKGGQIPHPSSGGDNVRAGDPPLGHLNRELGDNLGSLRVRPFFTVLSTGRSVVLLLKVGT